MRIVLIVDDEESICWGLAKLAEVGHTAATAASAEAGPRVARAAARPTSSCSTCVCPAWTVWRPWSTSGPRRPDADHRHDRLRRAVHRRTGGPQRGLRLPDQAVRSGRGAAGDPAGLHNCPPAGRAPRARRRAPGDAIVGSSPPCRRSSSGSPWSPPPMPACTCTARAAPARSWRPGPSIATAAGPTGRSWPSTWPRSAPRWPRASCSATSAGRSPAPTSPQGPARTGRRRHDLPRRSGRHPAGLAGEAAARARARRDPARGRRSAGAQRFPPDLRDAPGPGRRVAEGAFRHDLYFRLITFEIEMPPLRQRRDDIRPLAEHFLALLAAKSAALGRPSRPRRSASWSGARGSATCASCATRSSTP